MAFLLRLAMWVVLSAGAMLLLVSCTQDTLSSGGKSEGDRPQGFAQFTDIPIPSGADIKMNRSVVTGERDAWTGRLVLSDWHGVGTMYDFYKSNMPRYGWQEFTTVRSETSVLTYTRGPRVMTVQIQGSFLWGSDIVLTASPGGGASGAVAPSSEPSGATGGPPALGRAPSVPVQRSP